MESHSARRPYEGLRQGLHIVVLSSFAIAQPLFDIFGHNATFFVASRASVTDIALFAVILLLLPPALVCLMCAFVSLASRKAARVLGDVGVGGLFALALMPPVVRNLGAVGAAPLMILAAAAGGVVYRRVSRARQVLTWLAPVPLVFAALFLLGSPVRDLLLPAAPATRLASAGSSPPVVVIVWDEFSMITLMKPDGTLDRTSFPNFARLADRSTWYPGATTVHYATDFAVPAALSGKMPTGRKVAPIAADHPDTLFSLLGGRYDILAFESVTKLCPKGLCRDIGAPTADRKRMAKDVAIVYLHMVLPKDAAERLPELGDRWAGFDTGDGDDAIANGDAAEGAARWTREDRNQGLGYNEPSLYFDRFVASIDRPIRPTLWFLHTLLPHKPWRFLPSGQAYETGGQRLPGWKTTGIWGSDPYLTQQGQQRYVLQAKFADALLGRVLDRLEKEGILDDALFVTFADHGVAFRPDAPQRRIVPKNVQEILPMPLFVKLPHQRRGAVDWRNAQTIDVMPTIADALTIPLPWQVDGFSLLKPDPKLRAKFCFSPEGRQEYPPVIPGLREASAELRGHFGGSFEDLFAFGPNAGLVGRRLAGLPVDGEVQGMEFDLERPTAYARVDPDAAFLPARLTGTVLGPQAPVGLPLAVSVDGTIAGVGQTFLLRSRVQVSIMLDPSRFRDRRTDLRLFVVRPGGRLARVPIVGRPS